MSEKIEEQDLPDSLLRGATLFEVKICELGILEASLVRPIDAGQVQELTEKDASFWDPIEVRAWPAGIEKPSPEVVYHVVSGNHRTTAARLMGLETLTARFIDAPDEKRYLLAAIGSNTRHGKNFTKEENTRNVHRLHAHGCTVTEIANLLGYSKSTISRMITGNDSHAAHKQQQEAMITAQPVYVPIARETGGDGVKRKIAGLLMDARIEVTQEEALAYLRTLTPAQCMALHELSTWLQEVLACLA